MLCANGTAQSNKPGCDEDKISADACNGDEGGPLLVNNVLVGINSAGYGCGNRMYPSVYGNVGNFKVRQWIRQITGRIVPGQCYDINI